MRIERPQPPTSCSSQFLICTQTHNFICHFSLSHSILRKCISLCCWSCKVKLVGVGPLWMLWCSFQVPVKIVSPINDVSQSCFLSCWEYCQQAIAQGSLQVKTATLLMLMFLPWETHLQWLIDAGSKYDGGLQRSFSWTLHRCATLAP